MARRDEGAPERLSLSALRTTLDGQGTPWQAEDTGLATLSPEEQTSRLGLRVDPEELEANRSLIASANLSARFLFSAIAVPAAVDWRNNGGNFVTRVKDQSNCGSCVSFGTIATIESRMNIACRTPGADRDYAEAYLFYCGCGNCCVPGWNFSPALDFCKNTGVAADASFPYTPGNQPCPAGVTPLFKITGYTTALSIAERKAAISERGPVVGGMAVYEDFYAYRSGVYRYMQGPFKGYHAISVVGYDDAQGCWIAKNSWGPGWGEGGFFRVAYGQVLMDTEFAFYEPLLTCVEQPAPDSCQQFIPSLQRVITAARTNPQLRRCLLYYLCGRGPRPYCPAPHLTVVNAVRTILTRCPQYREPFCRAIA